MDSKTRLELLWKIPQSLALDLRPIYLGLGSRLMFRAEVTSLLALDTLHNFFFLLSPEGSSAILALVVHFQDNN